MLLLRFALQPGLAPLQAPPAFVYCGIVHLWPRSSTPAAGYLLSRLYLYPTYPFTRCQIASVLPWYRNPCSLIFLLSFQVDHVGAVGAHLFGDCRALISSSRLCPDEFLLLPTVAVITMVKVWLRPHSDCTSILAFFFFTKRTHRKPFC